MTDAIQTTINGITQADLIAADAQVEGHQQVEVEGGHMLILARNMTIFHTLIIKRLLLILEAHVKAHHLGTVLPDGARYILTSQDDRIQKARVPDLSFLKAGRLTPDCDWDTDFQGAPDLAVEVVSPGQGNALLLHRLGDYLGAGTEEAWLIHPRREHVFQYRRDDDAPNTYRRDDVIDTSALFPGLTLRLADLMRRDDP